MTPLDLDTIGADNQEPASRSVVRIRTTCYQTPRGLAIRREVLRMVRLSTGLDLLGEEISAIGLPDAAEAINNLLDVEDGLYCLKYLPGYRDLETGILESDGLTLVPFTP